MIGKGCAKRLDAITLAKHYVKKSVNSKLLTLTAAIMMLTGGCAPTDTPVRLVFLGDSITEAGAQPGGYVTLVRHGLEEVYANRPVDVIGAGISGNKVPDLQERLERDVLVHDPTHVVIYIGINDVWHHFEFDHVTGTEPDAYAEGLADLVQTIQGRGAFVWLCTPSVIGEDPGSKAPVNQRLMEYADITRSVAQAAGAELCDLRTAFEQYLATHNASHAYQGILTSDGVHLNEAGNRFVADFMLEQIREELSQ